MHVTGMSTPRKSYKTDVTDAEREFLAPYLVLMREDAPQRAYPLRGVFDALRYGVRFSGCTVHFLDEGVDTGPIIVQAVVPVHEDDTEETLAARILKEEHRIYPMAIRLFLEGRLTVEGRKVITKGARKIPDFSRRNPDV